MEVIKKNKLILITLSIFTTITLIHILYASFSFRGLYGDGTYYMIKQLTNCVNDVWKIYSNGHARYSSLLITQLPILAAYKLFFIKSKFALMFIYTFFQLTIPLIGLYWSYKLSERTNKPEFFLFNIFMYCCIILTYEIWSVVESIQGIAFNVILLNYLTAKTDYKKRDIIGIIFLLFMMFGTYEYVIYLGIMMFIFSIYYIKKESTKTNKFVKLAIGIGSLAASVFNIYYLFRQKSEYDEISRFFDFSTIIDNYTTSNILLTIATVLLIIIFSYKKRPVNKPESLISVIILTFIFIYLICNHENSLIPNVEINYRVLPCFLLPAFYIYTFVKDIKTGAFNEIKYINILFLISVCGIFQTFYQMTHTYYWNKNVSYFKSQISQTNERLYIPEEHEEISSEYNPDNRRYLWINTFPALSLLLSDTYEIKTLILTYKENYKNFDSFREQLYVSKNVEGKIKLPAGIFTDIKNEFWDLTECAKALDEYNIKNNIKIEQE